MSLRTTGMPAELMTWAISPPIVPAPTTAALVTNMAARLQACFVRGFCGKAAESAFQSHCERPADEQGVGDLRERTTVLELVFQLHRHLPGFEEDRLPAVQLILEDLRDHVLVVALEDPLGDAPTTGRAGLPHDFRA